MLKVQIPVTTQNVLRSWDVLLREYDIAPVLDEYNSPINRNPIYKYDDDGKPIGYVTKNVQKTYEVNNKEYFKIKGDYMAMINSFREKSSDQFIGGMPVQIEKDCVKQLLRRNKFNPNEMAYSITLKVDGERFLMFIDLDSDFYLIDRSTNIFYLTDNGVKINLGDMPRPCLLDGELVEHSEGVYEFLVFDILFYPNKEGVLTSWIYQPYAERYYVASNAVNYISKQFNCTLKQFFPINLVTKTTDIYKLITNETNITRKKYFKPALVSDGLILQPNDTAYVTFREWNKYNNVQFKWKPSSQLTIDFRIKKITNKKWVLCSSTGMPFMVQQGKNDPVPATCIPSDKDATLYHDNEVVEFKYQEKRNPQKNMFTPMRSRSEKSANGYKTIMSTLYAIAHPFDLDDLSIPMAILEKGNYEKPGLSVILNSMFSKGELILFALKAQNMLFFKGNKSDQPMAVTNNIIEETNENVDQDDPEIGLDDINNFSEDMESRFERIERLEFKTDEQEEIEAIEMRILQVIANNDTDYNDANIEEIERLNERIKQLKNKIKEDSERHEREELQALNLVEVLDPETEAEIKEIKEQLEFYKDSTAGPLTKTGKRIFVLKRKLEELNKRKQLEIRESRFGKGKKGKKGKRYSRFGLTDDELIEKAEIEEQLENFTYSNVPGVPGVQSRIRYLTNRLAELKGLKRIETEKTTIIDKVVKSSSSEIGQIKNIYKNYVDNYSPNMELEFRIFTSTKKNGGMDKTNFFYLLDFLWDRFPHETKDTIDIYLNVYSKNSKTRSTYSSYDNLMKKKSDENLKKIDIESFLLSKSIGETYNGLGFKLSLSEERPSEVVVKQKNQIQENVVTNMIRAKHRISFKLNELWRVDATFVKTSYSLTDLHMKNDSYEFECEYTGGPNVSPNEFVKSVSDIVMVIFSNASYC
jgi:hypothetical protein